MRYQTCGMSIDVQRERTTLSERIAEEIRALLARRRMSGRELTRKLGVSPNWLSLRLTGVQAIDVNDLERIATALDVRPIDLVSAAEDGTTLRYPDPPLAASRRLADRRPPGHASGAHPPTGPGRTARVRRPIGPDWSPIIP
jgi:DNA-binding Xre family transcriptional regulator